LTHTSPKGLSRTFQRGYLTENNPAVANAILSPSIRGRHKGDKRECKSKLIVIHLLAMSGYLHLAGTRGAFCGRQPSLWRFIVNESFKSLWRRLDVVFAPDENGGKCHLAF
jgi:hypothetical protein